MKNIKISTPSIKLGQFLKYAGIVDTGGAMKPFLLEHTVQVNGSEETRRGRQLQWSDVVTVDGATYRLVKDEG